MTRWTPTLAQHMICTEYEVCKYAPGIIPEDPTARIDSSYESLERSR